MLVKILNPNAKMPFRATSMSAGYDLFSCENIEVLPRQRAMIGIGLAIRVPPGTYGRIAPRSGLAVKYGIDTLAGVLDEDFDLEVRVILYNTGDKPYKVSIGDRIAQLILEKIETPEPLEVKDLPRTSRAGGFGSTGV